MYWHTRLQSFLMICSNHQKLTWREVVVPQSLLDFLFSYFLFRGELVKKFYFEEPVYGIDVSPESPNLFATASEDGTVQICDVRSTDGA